MKEREEKRKDNAEALSAQRFAEKRREEKGETRREQRGCRVTGDEVAGIVPGFLHGAARRAKQRRARENRAAPVGMTSRFGRGGEDAGISQ